MPAGDSSSPHTGIHHAALALRWTWVTLRACPSAGSRDRAARVAAAHRRTRER
ncbi:hypothetical protein PXO_05806 [Xanthomonas oryzae pv. oryzae PXO99A]|uniref:Uncharacterized protein n=1 Tax=Xanthomonas oryzae pv. oryzae (strain PXO99A) TaxID=360094 RepID=A0A0K0GFM4_XANOP|nr:hypothetical protein PXO_05806 [Xanthomonas oryzae pv. oryzae PXO99A]